MKEIKLNSQKSPYFVKYSKNVVKVIEYASERKLSEEYGIKSSSIQNFLKKKSNLPLWIVEASCKINSKHIFVPAQYQQLWFCLHGTTITRKQPSGRVFQTRVNFPTCYLRKSEEIKELINKAKKKINLPLYKLSALCGNKKHLSNNKEIISFLTLIKICQITKTDLWELVKGKELFGKTSKIGEIIIPKDFWNINLAVLLIWLRTEGHLELASSHVEINQKNSVASLRKLEAIAHKGFCLKIRKRKLNRGKRGEDRLIFSSSPLRQFLCLKYNIPLGYKSGTISKLDFNYTKREDYLKLIAAFIETEGCLSYCYTRNKKNKLPRFEFVVKDRSLAEECIATLKELGYSPHVYYKHNIFKVGLYNSNKVIKLVKEVKSSLFDKKKLIYLKKVCTNGIGL